jgi:hypothetical protein
MPSRKDKICDRISSRLRASHERIYPKPTQGLFNFRCFENSVQYCLDSKKDLKVFEVIYIDEYPCLHYLVKDKNDYLEVTIGWRAEHVEYYLIREVPKEDWIYIGSIFNNSLKFWYMEYTNWFDRNILSIDRVV